MKKRIVSIFLIFFPLIVNGQDITVQAEYPSVVEAGQQFTVSWTVNEGGGEFSTPPFDGFNKLMGPQTSYSSSTQYINGKMSHQTTYSYVYYLQALQAGKYEIKPATFTLKGKTYSSEPMKIEVVGSGGQNQQGAQASGSQNQKTQAPASAGGSVFVDLGLSRKEVYQGESIFAIVKLYTRENLGGINEIKYPSFTNFLKADIETPQLTSLRQENFNGTVYGTGVLQQFLLYPQVTGEITIDPVQVTVLVQQKSAQTDPFFGDFFNNYENVPRAIASKPVMITVKPLPGDKPSDFSGIVGKISIKATMNKDSVNVNDAINFKVVVSGNGNLKLAGAPSLKLSPDVEVYEPKITDDVRNSSGGTSGQKIFEFTLIPRHYGEFTIPSVTYSYFNTSTGRYERLSTGDFHFYARKGNDQGSQGSTVYNGVSKEDVKYLGKDIRFIRNNPGKLIKSSDVLISEQVYYSLFIIVLAAFIIVLIIRREHVRRNADITAVKNRKAGKVAVKRLRNASVCLKQNEMDKFHEEILKALWGYLSDKLNIPVSDLTRQNAVETLKAKGIDDEKISLLAGILDKCEYARFAPSGTGVEANEIYNGASRFISDVENSIG
jgi:hypothetical protein